MEEEKKDESVERFGAWFSMYSKLKEAYKRFDEVELQKSKLLEEARYLFAEAYEGYRRASKQYETLSMLGHLDEARDGASSAFEYVEIMSRLFFSCVK